MYGDTSMPISKESTLNDMICDLDLDEIFVENDIQASWSNLKSSFLDIMDSCIPKAVLPTRRKAHAREPKTSSLYRFLVARNFFFYKMFMPVARLHK